MIRIKCFTSAACYSYPESRIPERHPCSKKATPKLGFEIVYMGDEVTLLAHKLVWYQTLHTRTVKGTEASSQAQ